MPRNPINSSGNDGLFKHDVAEVRLQDASFLQLLKKIHQPSVKELWFSALVQANMGLNFRAEGKLRKAATSFTGAREITRKFLALMSYERAVYELHDLVTQNLGEVMEELDQPLDAEIYQQELAPFSSSPKPPRNPNANDDAPSSKSNAEIS